MWKGMPYSTRTDLWSLGCILHELATLHPPFSGKDIDTVFKQVTSGKYSEIPPMYTQSLKSMIKALLHVHPSLRPSCGISIFSNDYFNRSNIK